MTSSPFQTRAWLRATGALDRVQTIAAGTGASIDAWIGDPTTPLGCHHFHNPRELISGAREEPFFAGGPSARAVLARARDVDWGAGVLTVSPYGYRGGPRTARDTPPSGLGALADGVIAFARQRGATYVMSHYLLQEEADWIRALVDRGGTPVVLGADAVLDIRWETIADYHAWLGRSRRSVRSRAAWGEPTLSWETRSASGLGRDQSGVPELLERHAARFDPLGHPPSALLRTVAEGSVSPRTLLTAAGAGASPRSALVSLDTGTALYPKFFGTDRPRADYFPLVFNRLIAEAIRRRYDRIEYGGGSHRAKLFRGARLRPLLGVLVPLEDRLRDHVLPAARLLSAAKRAYFDALSERWHVEHEPFLPRAVR